jgi:integrase
MLMTRNRESKTTQNLPLNLYFEPDRKRYRYRHPITGKKYVLSSNRQTAIKQANLLNAQLIPLKDHTIKILTENTPEDLSFSEFLQVFEHEILPKNSLSDSTLKDYKQKLVIINRELSRYSFNELNVLTIANFLNSIKGTTNSNRYRSLLIQIFKHAIARGLTKQNPATDTLPKKETVKRQRLTLDGFKAIHANAEEWFKNVMELALQTLQRRSDIVSLKWSDIKDGYLHVQQQKVEKHGTGLIKIKITPEIETLLKRFEENANPDNPYIVQRIKRYKTNRNEALKPEDLSRFFQEARDRCGLYDNKEMAERPTFHEIRSLGIRLYKDAGLSDKDIMALSGHATDEMYRLYLSRHSEQWIIAENAGLHL